MSYGRAFRALLATVLAACIACPPAHALVALNEGHDRIYVTGSFSVSHDSNVFATPTADADYIYSSSLVAEYTRRAGWIGVNGVVSMNLGSFVHLKSQNFSDPNFSLELTKQNGRTTGAINLSAARESRADPAVNSRTSTWNYNAGLNVRYRISGTYDLAGQFGYNQRKYSDETLYTNLSTYSAGLDLFHVFSTERDLILGYRYRYGETSHNTSSTDQSLSLGVHGKIVRGVNGTLRVGYQYRTPHGQVTLGESSYQSWTASGSATYAINKKANIVLTLAKDFSTTATDSSVDVLTASIDGQYAYNSHWSTTSSFAWGSTQFLGLNGRAVLDPGPPIIFGPERHDDYLSWNTTLSYSMNEHLKISLTYLWFKNWSTSSFSDFVRTSWGASLTSRW